MFFYYKPDGYCDDSKPLPDPILDIPCIDDCYDGEEATITSDFKSLKCTICPENTYSIGQGGMRIDGQMGAFA